MDSIEQAFVVPTTLRWWGIPIFHHVIVSQWLAALSQTLTHGQAGSDVAELGQLLGDGVYLDAQFSGGNQHQHASYRSLARFVD